MSSSSSPRATINLASSDESRVRTLRSNSSPDGVGERSMSTKQDFPGDGIALDRNPTPTSRDYERRWWTLGVLCMSLS